MSTTSESALTTHLTKLTANKSSVEPAVEKEVTFRINAKIEDEEKKPDHVRIKFELSITTDPKFATIELEGIAMVSGENMARLEKSDSTGNVPLIVLDLYQKLYPIIFLMTNAIGSPAPSPALLSAPEEAPKK